jgi:hypothetical protein
MQNCILNALQYVKSSPIRIKKPQNDSQYVCNSLKILKSPGPNSGFQIISQQ